MIPPINLTAICEAQSINNREGSAKKGLSRVDDIDANIFIFLSVENICNIKPVNHRFKKISSRPSIWKEILKRNGINPSEIESNSYEPLLIQSEKRRKIFLERALKSIYDSVIIKAIQKGLKYKTSFDELLKISNQIRSPLDRILARIDIGKELLSTNPEKAARLFNEALVFKASKHKKKKILSRLVKATASRDPQGANKIALKIKQHDKRILALIDILILSHSHEALEFLNMDQDQNIIFVDKDQTRCERVNASSRYLKAYELAHQIADFDQRAKTFINIGIAQISINSQAAYQCFSEAHKLVDQDRVKYKNHILQDLVKAKATRYPQEAEEIADQIEYFNMCFESFIEIAKAQTSSDPKQADNYCNELLKGTSLIDDPLKKVNTLLELVKIKVSIGLLEEAEKIACQVAMAVYGDDPTPIALAYIDIGKSWMTIDVKQAAICFNKVLEILSQIENPLGKDTVCLELSMCYIDGNVFPLKECNYSSSFAVKSFSNNSGFKYT